MHPIGLHAGPDTLLAAACAILGAAPWVAAVEDRCGRLPAIVSGAARWAGDVALVSILFLAAVVVSGDTSSPFIYFRF